MVKKYLKLIFINLLVTLVLVELVCMIYIRTKKIVVPGYEKIPSYVTIISDGNITFKGVLSGAGDSVTINPISPRNIDTLYPWCTWHPLNRTHREVFSCFDVLYKFNSMGTRGSLPNQDDPNNIFFIGDSYVEGFGLEEDSTISERIKQSMGKPVLNLGTSGHFSPTQMSLIYPEFAKKFKHKEIYVMFYLENDFIENNVNNHYKLFANRYRPYRILGEDSSYIAYKGSIDSTSYCWKNFNAVVRKGFPIFREDEGMLKRLLKLCYTTRCLHLLKSNANTIKPEEVKPSELLYTANDLTLLENDMASIMKTASLYNAKVTFVNLPSKYLLKYAGESAAIAKEYKQLEDKLSAISAKGNARYLSFFDFIQNKKMKTDLLFFPCDFHYSNYGESTLSDFIQENYKN